MLESRPQAALKPRNLVSLLDETFAVYSRNVRFWIVLVAVVQAPMALVSYVLAQTWGGAVSVALAGLLSAMGVAYVYAATLYGVGQHYVTGGIVFRDCHARAFWRARSLAALTLAAGITIIALLSPVSFVDNQVVAALATLAMIPAVAIAVYWSMAVQAIVVEGNKSVGALRRSFALVRGNWWRTFGIGLTFLLVAMGLAIVVSIPFAAVSALASADTASRVANVILALGQMTVAVVVPPVLFIGWTLFYYDMRVRKEEYDVAALSRELGLVAA
jgi:hypothetical protein